VSGQAHIHRLADEELLELVRRGDVHAFEAVYDRHGGPVFSLAYRMLGNRLEAEDIAQETFLALWRGRFRYQPERGSVRTWLTWIVHRRSIDALRRNGVRRRRWADSEQLEEEHEAPERTDVEAARREEARRIRDAIAALPDGQGRIIELAYFGGFTHVEIAQMLELPLGTVKGRMRLGLDKLRASLQEQVAV